MAIAFYDSGRLLPYRHKQLSEQIQQRNQDAERTRQYIGYAGGAFANMAEKTGQIFGADLYSGYQQGKEGDPKQVFYGGTTGRDVAKSGWQKGITDEENNRREVTHRLGLLMKNVEYGNLQRDYEAWGGRDKKVLRKAYNDTWEAHLEEQKMGIPKIELMQKYSSLYDKETNQLLAAYKVADPDEKERLGEMLEKRVASYNTFELYADGNNLYDKSVAARPREDVNLLLAYLQDGVKFPGMNQIMSKFEGQQKNRRKISNQLKDEDPSQLGWKKLMELRKSGEIRPKKTTTSTDDGVTTQESTESKRLNASQISPWNFIARADLSDQQQEERRQKLAKAEVQYDRKFEPYKGFQDSAESILPLDVVPATEEERNELVNTLSKRSLLDISLVNKDSSGNMLSPFDALWQTALLVKDVALQKNREDKSYFTSDAQKKINDLKNRAIAEQRATGETTELGDLETKFGGLLKMLIATDENPNLTGMERGAGNALLRRNDLPASSVELNELGQPIKNIVTTNQDLAPLRAGDSQVNLNNAILNTIANEDARSTGYPFEDNKHTILAGAVNAWEIIGGDKRKISQFFEQVPMSAGKQAQFRKYFKSNNPNEYLGHKKKTGSDPNSEQKRNRANLYLDPEQTKAVVGWAYNNNLNNLKANHMFLTNSVLESNPALSQILGDMAYRHGGGFMRGSKINKHGLEERYPGLPDAIKKVLDGKRFNKPNSTIEGLNDMQKLLFGQGRYDLDKTEKEERAWPSENLGPRIKFLRERFDQFAKSSMPFNAQYMNLQLQSN